eukprot:6189316-Pleurochrysis_carterae.AAC.4
MTDYKKWEALDRDLAEEKDEEEIARERLRQLREDMSDKEARRLHECWEKPEFRQLFQECACLVHISQAVGQFTSCSNLCAF